MNQCYEIYQMRWTGTHASVIRDKTVNRGLFFSRMILLFETQLNCDHPPEIVIARFIVQ